jgi:hypothetical protein
MEVLMTKYIRIDYTVKPDVDLDELKAAIAEFVAGIRSHFLIQCPLSVAPANSPNSKLGNIVPGAFTPWTAERDSPSSFLKKR